MKKVLLNLVVRASVLALYMTTAHAATETRTPGNFTGIELSGAYKVILKAGTSCSVMLEGTETDLQAIKTKVNGDDLEVSVKDHSKLSGEVKVTITYVTLHEIDCSGTVSLEAENVVKSDALEIDLSGTGKAELELSTGKLKLDISGTGSVALKGTATKADVDISGAGKLMASGLQTESFDIDISGVGNAEIAVSKELDAEISGTGSVKYKGEPTVHQSVSGTGKVVKL